MVPLRLYLFDDAVARDWQPFALTRPIGEILLGAHTFRARAEHLFSVACQGHLTSAHLLGFSEPDAPPVIPFDDVGSDQPRVMLSSRALLGWRRPVLPERTAILECDDGVIGAFVAPGDPGPSPEWLLQPRAEDFPAAQGRTVHLDGALLNQVWDVIPANAAQITRDYEATRGRNGLEDAERAGQFQAIAYRSGMLRLGAGVTIEPNVVIDFTNGPVWLDEGATVRAFTRLAGPAFIGARTTLLGGPYDALSAGPGCKLHGEIEESVVLGYSNKAHDGFLGHALLGRWVNLGAMTTNSDLKNNYGTIRMPTGHGEVDTGLIKLGCLLGDHVKTGIGALLNTGTVVGAGSNLFGTEMPPKYVPPFSWGSGSDLTAYDVDRFLAVAAIVMSRRNIHLDEGMAAVLRKAWRIGRDGV